MTSLRRTALALATIGAFCASSSVVEAKGKRNRKIRNQPRVEQPAADPTPAATSAATSMPEAPGLPGPPPSTPDQGFIAAPDPGLPTPDPGSTWDRKNNDQNQFIVRGEAGEIQNIAARYGLTVLESVSTASPGGDVALLAGPTVLTEAQVLEMVEPDDSVFSSEATELARLPLALLEQSTSAILEQSTSAILESINATGVTADVMFRSHFTYPVWAGYTDQPAAQVLDLAKAQGNGYGSGIVAVIDNGVDPYHPLLQGALIGGYDFILDQAGTASEWANLDQSTSAILEQSTSAILEQSTSAILEGNTGFFLLEQSTSAILEQSTSAILEQHELPPSFGHGTLVAGIIRLVAPGAQIMPLRAFDGEGTGNLFDIVRAVHFAVDNGADVINMSFSLDSYSPELARAIDYARRNGVICVAAAGNQGKQKPAYPASFGTTIGVGSTNDLDQLSSFSNFGTDLVLISAPGEGVISTYPGGTYAAAWGTSFAAPFVAGTIALIHNQSPSGQLQSATDFFNAMSAVAGGAQYLPLLAAEISIGRLDAAGTLIHLLSN